MENENNTPTPEELQVEQESLAEVADDKLRSSIVDFLGLEDNDTNATIIERAIEREKMHRQKLSGAVGAKIKWRTEAQKVLGQLKGGNKSKADSFDPEAIRKQTEETVRAQFDEEYLEESDFSDNLKAEMRKVAKLKGTTVRAATKDSYVQFLMEKEKAEKRALEVGKNGSGTKKGVKDGGAEFPEEFNDPTYMATSDGQKAYDEWAKNKKT